MIPLLSPTPTNRLEGLLRRVQETPVLRNHGRVVQLIGLVIESEGPLAAVGEICRIESARHDGVTLAEVVGFRNHHVLLMPLGEIHGIHPGSEVVALGTSLRVPVGDGLKGRVIDGLGHPLDDLGPL
ncbi:MAG: flagellum-specific ATP synthase FliI, partial [Opitutaceae bacterium]|nr:flagellum-specific ATP synthase FliI [Verrucomicrobiales bacterium]